MKRYQIHRKRIFGREGELFCPWVPYSSRLYKSRGYVQRKVFLLNSRFDGYFYRVATLEQEEFAFD